MALDPNWAETARVSVSGVYATGSGAHRFTAFCAWPETPDGEAEEEIDVDADSRVEARAMVVFLLERDYIPGGRIVALQQRPRGFCYI